jgi:hypothetical protein
MDYNQTFAQNGERLNIPASDWRAGWVRIVGGLNGIPTAEQFNTFGHTIEEKANAVKHALDALTAALASQNGTNAIGHGSQTLKQHLDGLSASLDGRVGNALAVHEAAEYPHRIVGSNGQVFRYGFKVNSSGGLRFEYSLV